MQKTTFLLFLLCLPLLHNAQTLKGKVYDSKGTIKNIKVYNKTQNRLTLTNDDGDFSITANVKDSITFESLFYHKKTIILEDIHFTETFVFELKEILNELDEVEIKAEPEQPVFTEETYNAELKNILKEDIKNNPHLYQPTSGNILAVLGLVAKLLKKKDKYREPIYKPITYTQIDSLFDKSDFFNKELLSKDLKIPEDKTYLFYDFCDAKEISSKLLKDENKMLLLEELVLNSQLFLIILEEYKEKNVSKE
ncbi:hypothetical protein HNV08_14125 [Winogradskyella eckloniae]|uniref:hypothetical protein n=1 Tax=Winogradskyella eckloniae TaxID=1089306 RepID=UPI001566C49D|nr:hypothetical protein [Winogradskyella eckloniae]NRD21192.1 hypothetical protein [Winogradskyella eckloniae]